jgi:hypothetical protein
MAKQDQFIRLLLVEDSAEERDRSSASCANGGMAVAPGARRVACSTSSSSSTASPIDLVLVNLRSKLLPDRRRRAPGHAGRQGPRVIALLRRRLPTTSALSSQPRGVFSFATALAPPNTLQAVVAASSSR